MENTSPEDQHGREKESFCSMLLNSKKVEDKISLPAQILQAEIDLQRAVKVENYEEAAIQRDLITELKEL